MLQLKPKNTYEKCEAMNNSLNRYGKSVIYTLVINQIDNNN